MCGILGIGLPLTASYLLVKKKMMLATFRPEGKAIIIGAGVGGLSAAYLLNQRGIDFEILEATSQFAAE
ncbi:MAG: NAD(P)-binding protein [Saprospiraceae bacterium]